ncbi:glycosyltransferase, partial [Amylibacter sp.]|nr:glycosyltransferase [Amylibacter sp.]
QSLEDCDTAIKTGISNQDKILAIGNGVDVEIFNPEKITKLKKRELRLDFKIPDNAIVVGMICRLVKEKGVLEFLEAALSLCKDNKKLYFMLVGERLESDHAESVSVEMEEAKKKLTSQLIFTGMRNDIPELLSIMDIYCLPSWREGMPRTIIEAMMMKKPVIATNIRGCREEVEVNETGLIVPVRNPKKLEMAILKMYSDLEWAKELGLSGRKKALKLYDEAKVISLQIEKISEISKHNSK